MSGSGRKLPGNADLWAGQQRAGHLTFTLHRYRGLVRFFQSEVLINARASTEWHVITDATNFGVWESGILEADRQIRASDTVHITPAGGRRPIKLHVQQIEGEVMTWKRSLPLGLWASTRTFTLTTESAHTRLAVTEDHRGLLLPFSKHPNADPFLDRFTEAIRARSEILDRVS